MNLGMKSEEMDREKHQNAKKTLPVRRVDAFWPPLHFLPWRTVGEYGIGELPLSSVVDGRFTVEHEAEGTLEALDRL